MEQTLRGKTAMITAAANGIGRASAKALAARGATVIATDIATEALADLHASHPSIRGTRLDVLDTTAVHSLVAGLGPLDIVVNCAGWVHDGTILDCDAAAWDRSFDLNARAVFEVSRAALPGMLDRGAGSIINIASIVSSEKGAPRRFAYGASKAAIIGMTKSIAADFVQHGIRCNAICPGTVQSPSLDDRLAATGDYDAALAAFRARQPMGRLGRPEELAEVVCYLASDMAAFTPGQAIAIDGGWSI